MTARRVAAAASRPAASRRAGPASARATRARAGTRRRRLRRGTRARAGPARRRRARARRGNAARASRGPRASGSSTRGARTRAQVAPQSASEPTASRTSAQPRALEHRPGLEQLALADRERRERDHRSADREREPERDSGHDEQPGPTGLPLELDGEWARRELVDDPAGREHDERADGEPERRGAGDGPHATRSVNGAVRTCPFTWHCRKSRQVPGTGTSTPTVSLPGVVELPVTFVAPSTLVQPPRPRCRRGCGSSRASPCGRRSRARGRRTTA